MHENRDKAAVENGFKQLPLAFLPRLRELAGARLSIFIAYLLRGNKDNAGLAWPSLKTLADDTGFKDSDWLRQERAELVKGGWLVPDGYVPSKRGGAPVPRFRAVLPSDNQPPRKSGTEIVSPRESQGSSPRESQGTPRNSGPGETPARTIRSKKEESEIKEGNHTNPSTPLVGWMVDLFIELTLTAPFYNDDDAYAIELLVEKHGEPEVRRVWPAFFHRAGGLGDVKRPFRLFVSEFRILQQLASELESCHLI